MGKQKQAGGVAPVGKGAGAAAGGAGGSYILDIREGAVALLRFKTKDAMNAMLDPISNALEGTIANRLGHNFALNDADKLHQALRKSLGLGKQICYVVATLDGDAHSVRHEMCHARYFLEAGYKQLVQDVWQGALSETQRTTITVRAHALPYMVLPCCSKPRMC